MTRTVLRVTGTVQGVGFRPFVYRHAVALGLAGFVLNDSAGVLIDVEGGDEQIAELTRLLVDDAPPLARVASVVAEPASPPRASAAGFRIVESDHGGRARLSRSASTAPPAPPAWPRSTTRPTAAIGTRSPTARTADRATRSSSACRTTGPATTMAGFTMCPACQAEYDDPADRRFHAQPNACPVCGPQLAWRDPTGTVIARRVAARPGRADGRPAAAAPSWRSRASAATTSPSTPPTPRRWASCAGARRATTSRSR